MQKGKRQKTVRRGSVRAASRLALFVGSLLTCLAATADDLAGWMRVRVSSNGLTAVSMPFSPFEVTGGSDPGEYVAVNMSCWRAFKSGRVGANKSGIGKGW